MTIKEFIEYLKIYPEDSLIMVKIQGDDSSLNDVVGFEYLVGTNKLDPCVNIVGGEEYSEDD